MEIKIKVQKNIAKSEYTYTQVHRDNCIHIVELFVWAV